jgi:predicted methyltransferase
MREAFKTVFPRSTRFDLKRRQLAFGLPFLAAGLWSFKARAQAAGADLSALYASVAADPKRSEADKKMDAKRHPVEFLQFTGVKPGMHVLDLAAGAGYTTELLALAVGPTGRVFAQTEKLDPVLKQLAAALGNVTVVESGAQDPVPASARPLDMITIVLAYHDITYETVDRKIMNRELYDSLGPDGVLVVIDHSAKPGTGAADGKTLHRVDKELVKTELTDAGFHFDKQSNFLANPDDPRDQPFFKMTIPTDRFALRFTKN